IESMLVDQAMQPDKLVPMLKRAIDREKIEPRAQPPRRAKERVAPRGGAGAQSIHIWTRNLGSDWSLGLGEDHVDLTAEDCAAFVPQGQPQRGQTWSLPQKLTE